MSEPTGANARAGLYLHVPFCSRVCPYCDFAVRTGDRARRRRYVEHLLAEIELYAGYPLRFDTIYFGGGAYGVQAAAEIYWQKSAEELSWPEAALLAAVPGSFRAGEIVKPGGPRVVLAGL